MPSPQKNPKKTNNNQTTPSPPKKNPNKTKQKPPKKTLTVLQDILNFWPPFFLLVLKGKSLHSSAIDILAARFLVVSFLLSQTL